MRGSGSLSDKSNTTPLDVTQTKWIMQCCDGCALTFWDTEDAAISAFRGHQAIGHHAVLFAPGIIDPEHFRFSLFLRASPDQPQTTISPDRLKPFRPEHVPARAKLRRDAGSAILYERIAESYEFEWQELLDRIYIAMREVDEQG